ncbi:MAG: hypothetical protein B6243_06235 [Anaerolineaceae bacterium 4572_5.2]|nr:MAG: hypothetical protein B6243_06235 [Anaerolineaceae bacterium 4572_5.2]
MEIRDWRLQANNLFISQSPISKWVSYLRTIPYAVKLLLTDDKGRQGQVGHKIKISGAAEPEQPPVAVITAPGQAAVGEEVIFDASASHGESALVNYRWNFGDGNTADAISVTKSYNAAGIYNVTLTVVDDRGLESDSVSVQVEIIAESTPMPAGG